MPGQAIHMLSIPIDPASHVPHALRDRGVTEQAYEQYLSDVKAAYEDVHGSQAKIVMISMLVVWVITIPFVLYYFSNNQKKMNRRMAEINRALEPYGVYGIYPAGSKLGPGKFEFHTL